MDTDSDHGIYGSKRRVAAVAGLASGILTAQLGRLGEDGECPCPCPSDHPDERRVCLDEIGVPRADISGDGQPLTEVEVCGPCVSARRRAAARKRLHTAATVVWLTTAAAGWVLTIFALVTAVVLLFGVPYADKPLVFAAVSAAWSAVAAVALGLAAAATYISVKRSR